MVISTMIFACISLIILAVDPVVCYKDPTNESRGKYDLTSAIWVCFGVQLSIFLLLLLHYIKCGCLIRKIGAAMGVYYFGMVGAMCSSQSSIHQVLLVSTKHWPLLRIHGLRYLALGCVYLLGPTRRGKHRQRSTRMEVRKMVKEGKEQ